MKKKAKNIKPGQKQSAERLLKTPERSFAIQTLDDKSLIEVMLAGSLPDLN